MPKIETIKLRCLDPEAQKQFYITRLGMGLREDGAVSYSDAEAGILFEHAEAPYQPTAGDTYWKIALAVQNIERACDELTAMGIEVSAPRQFRDVGYLAHFQDPEGFKIELIEHWFQGSRPEGQADAPMFKGNACLNLLTLRTHAITPLREAFLGWGMTPLLVQPVEPYGFTLHFFAFTEETPPNENLLAVENREWVYQRPYTVLELQEVHDAPPMSDTPDRAAGYEGTWVSGANGSVANKGLRISS